ncbi:MAG: HAMP domain-containing histidine kinase, partial [Clostridia bacterium]|nr:HAMP domain-containing histidine kinase [Clostridia bacterium]
VGVYLLDNTGESALPELSDACFPEIAERLCRELEEKNLILFDNDKGNMSYGASMQTESGVRYLYLTIPARALNRYADNFRWMSLFTGALSLVLAFIASGVVALLITKPVTEVTERAKELARGNYSLDFRKNYFCTEMTELSEALESARTEISKADEVQKELIANVSHDFKTPLTMIKAYASMIREISGDDKEKRDAHAQVIIDESDRLTALVGDLLDLSRLRAGMTENTSTVFNLSEDVYRVAGRFDYLTETDGYKVEVLVEEDIYTLACRERIEQVLYNLIGNAVNYTGEDKRVRVKLYRKENCARFEVIDSGKGIPSEEVNTIWDRYYRSNSAHKRPVKGTGLGLSIVKSILLAQGCPFGVISEVGKGSCFWVEFPLPEEANGEVPTERKKKRTKGAAQQNGRTEEGKVDLGDGDESSRA